MPASTSAPQTDDGSGTEIAAGSITQEELDRLLAEEDSSDGEITLDETFDLLRNRRRRDVLLYLAGTDDGTATLSDLAEHVAAKENDIDREQLTSTQRKRVYIGLYQCHLPKMDDLGIVEYDQDRGTVVLQEDSKLLSYLPETTDESDQSQVPLYGALLVTAVVAVGVLGVGPVAAVPAVVWTALSTMALLAVAVYCCRL